MSLTISFDDPELVSLIVSVQLPRRIYDLDPDVGRISKKAELGLSVISFLECKAYSMGYKSLDEVLDFMAERLNRLEFPFNITKDGVEKR